MTLPPPAPNICERCKAVTVDPVEHETWHIQLGFILEQLVDGAVTGEIKYHAYVAPPLSSVQINLDRCVVCGLPKRDHPKPSKKRRRR
jgi:hypothetical protein